MDVDNLKVETISQKDKKIALYSLRLLFFITTFHAIWLGFKNSNNINNLFNYSSLPDLQSLVFLLFLIFINYISVIFAYGLYKNGKYRNQLISSTIMFIFSQLILHLILLLTGATFC